MTLSLSLPHADEAWLEGFACGPVRACGTVRRGAHGRRHGSRPTGDHGSGRRRRGERKWLTRSGADAGELLFVSGTPGKRPRDLRRSCKQIDGAEAGSHLRRRFLRPEPRVAFGRRLRTLASAAMDVSDGLLTDLEKLCEASGCGATLDVDALPASPEMQRAVRRPRACFELRSSRAATTMSCSSRAPVEAAEELARATTPAVTRIGVITLVCWRTLQRGGRPIAVDSAGLRSLRRRVRTHEVERGSASCCAIPCTFSPSASAPA